jgi:hypothetical protein
MPVKTYDPESFALAQHFMRDAPQPKGSPETRETIIYEFTHDLALEIQEAVEVWFEARARNGWAPLFEPVTERE